MAARDLAGIIAAALAGQWITNELGAPAASVAISSIPALASMAHLEIETHTRTDNAVTGGNVLVTWNSDTTTTNYHNQRGGGSNGSAVSAAANTNAPYSTCGASSPSGAFGHARILIPWYGRTDRSKEMRIFSMQEQAVNTRVVHLVAHKRITAGSGALTDAIASVLFTPASSANFIAGSIFRWRLLP